MTFIQDFPELIVNADGLDIAVPALPYPQPEGVHPTSVMGTEGDWHVLEVD